MSVARDLLALVGFAVMAWGIWGWNEQASIVFIGAFIFAAAASSAIKARNKMFDDQ